MEGSAKILSLIARDESQHLVLTQNILKKWADGDDPEMQEISQQSKEEVTFSFFCNFFFSNRKIYREA